MPITSFPTCNTIPLNDAADDLPLFGPGTSLARKISITMITIFSLMLVSGSILWGLGAHKIVGTKALYCGQGLVGLFLCVSVVTLWTRLNYPIFKILPD